MEQTIELRIVDPKTLTYADKRDPRQVPSVACPTQPSRPTAMRSDSFQPPLFSEEEHGTLTIIAGRRRIKSAIANKLKEMAILVKPADPLDDMRAVAENVVRAPMSPVDLWRAIEDLASKNWTEEAIATGRSPCRSGRSASSGSLAASIPRYSSTWAAATCPRSDTSARSPGRLSPNRPPFGRSRSPRRARQPPGTRSPILSRSARCSPATRSSGRKSRPPSASSGPKTCSPRPTRTAATRRRRRFRRRAARLARSQRSEERGNRSGRRLRRCQAPEGRDPGLGRQARQKGSHRPHGRPAKRGRQRGPFHAPCPRREGVEDRRRRRRRCFGR